MSGTIYKFKFLGWVIQLTLWEVNNINLIFYYIYLMFIANVYNISFRNSFVELLHFVKYIKCNSFLQNEILFRASVGHGRDL